MNTSIRNDIKHQGLSTHDKCIDHTEWKNYNLPYVGTRRQVTYDNTTLFNDVLHSSRAKMLLTLLVGNRRLQLHYWSMTYALHDEIFVGFKDCHIVLLGHGSVNCKRIKIIIILLERKYQHLFLCCSLILFFLNTLHTLSLHAFEFAAHAGLLLLALDLVLRVLKVTSVTEFHQVRTLADLLFESPQRRLDWFAISKLHLDLDSQFGRCRSR
jgi:hypothetical protein